MAVKRGLPDLVLKSLIVTYLALHTHQGDREKSWKDSSFSF